MRFRSIFAGLGFRTGFLLFIIQCTCFLVVGHLIINSLIDNFAAHDDANAVRPLFLMNLQSHCRMLIITWGLLAALICTTLQAALVTYLTRKSLAKTMISLGNLRKDEAISMIEPLPSTREFYTLAEQVNAVTSVVYDRTRELRQTNIALQNSRERYRTLIEHSTDWVWAVDSEFRYTFSNAVGERLLGLETGSIIGRDYFAFCTPERKMQQEEYVRDRARRLKPLERMERQLVSSDGTIVYLESSASIRVDSDGGFAGYQGIDRDVSERVHAQEAMQRRLDFEKFTASMSARFLACDQIRFDSVADNALKDISEFLDIDRVQLFINSDSSPGIRSHIATHGGSGDSGDAPDVSPFKDACCADLLHMLNSGQSVSFSDLDQLNDGLTNIETCFLKRGVKAALLTPILDDNRLRGILSFESLQVARRWSDDDRTLQRLTAELIGSVIRRLDAEYALIKNEAQYRQLFADALVAIFRSRIEDGEILQVNQAGAELLGKESPEKLLSDRFLVSELYPAPRRRELLDLLEKNEEIHNFEITMNPPGKNPIDISVSARIFPELGYIEGVMVDITDRNRAEAELKRLRLFMADIVNSLPSMVIGVNPAGLVTHWNRRASEMTGIPPAKARGSRIGDVLKDIPEIEALIRSVFTGGESCTTEVRVKVKGEYRNLDVKVLPLSSSEDSGAVIRVDDITDRRRMESMIVQSEKMLSIGGLAAGMAHEINNPLAAILQNLQVIRNRLFLDMERNEMVARECELDLHRMRRYLNRRNIDQMLESVMQSGHRASRIVDNMLSFSRKGDSRFTTTDIAALVDRTLELASNEYDLKKKYDFRKIRILKQYVENTPVVLCDPGQIQQVVFNILKNGAQAMATVSGKESEFLIRVYSENGWVVIAITDNGPGLEEAVRKRIFEPFFTTKEVGMGTGLGLSVSYYIIVENHRGELEVDSILGQGSTFYIRLPLEQTETQILRNVRRQTNA